MKGKSINGQTTDQISEALTLALADGFQPTLAIVYISIKLDRTAICEILHKEGIDIIGATSCGLFTNGFNDGYQGKGSAVILLVDINTDYYTILFENIENRNMEEAAEKLARDAMHKFRKPAFILLSTGVSTKGDFFNGELLVRSLESEVGSNTKIFGGMAGDDVTFKSSYVFTKDKSTDYGMAALILNEEKISLHGMAVSGWKPLGIERTATKSEGPWLYKIDDKSALEMYLKYLGIDSVSNGNDYHIIEEIGIYHPFQVEGIGDPVMRTPIMINKETGGLKMDFDIPQGAKFRFSVPPDFDIVENILEAASSLKNSKQASAEMLLIFSCVGRLNALGPSANQENEGLSKIWDAPMAGFFTYGEYGTVENERQGFHSTTCSWVALNENE